MSHTITPASAGTNPVARYAPLFVGCVALIAYLLTVPPGLTWDLGGTDGGELATAVYTLGVAHPPGYPTYVLVSQLARLLPLASFAHRLNVLSALAAAGAVTLVAWAGVRFAGKEEELPVWGTAIVGGVAGLLYGLGELVWTQAIITEVYALAGLFSAGLLALTVWIASAPGGRRFSQRVVIFAFLLGLGMGSHYLVGFIGIFAAAYLFLKARGNLLRPATLWIIPAFALGVSVFVYLPLRAGVVPISNWGNPNSLERVGWMLLGKAYANRFQPGLGFSPARLASLVRVWVQQLSVPGLALAIFGLSLWAEFRPKLFYATLLTIVLNFWLTAAYFSADTLPYSYPSLMLLALAAGSATHYIVFRWLPGWSADQRKTRVAVAAGLVIVSLGPVLLRSMNIVREADTTADTFSQNVVREAPSDGILFSEDTGRAFAIWYATTVSVGREDVIPVDTNLLSQDWYRVNLARFYPQLGLEPDVMLTTPIETEAGLLATLPPDVPIVFTYRPDLPAGYELASDGDKGTYRLTQRP